MKHLKCGVPSETTHQLVIVLGNAMVWGFASQLTILTILDKLGPGPSGIIKKYKAVLALVWDLELLPKEQDNKRG